MRRVLLAQARACADLGSPMYAELLTRAADDPGEAVADVLEGRTGPGFVLGMLGTVHRLVLEGRVPELAAHYPTAGGTADPLEAWPAFRDVLAAHAAEIRDGLADPPQTNEVGRAAPLVGGLLAVAEAARLPVRLLEIGASAGLNLRADRFRLLHETGSYGPESPVVLPGAWRGSLRWTRRWPSRSGGDATRTRWTRRRPGPGGGCCRTCGPTRRRGSSACGRRSRWPRRSRRRSCGRVRPSSWTGSPPCGGRHGRVALDDARVPVGRGGRPRRPAHRGRRGGGHRGGASGAPVVRGRDSSRLDAVQVVALRLWPGGERRILGEGPSHGLPITWL